MCLSSCLSLSILKLYCCKRLTICGIKISRFNENDVLVHSNFGVHDITWLQIVKKTGGKFANIFFLLNYTLCYLIESPR